MPQDFKSLTGLRGVAALGVMTTHFFFALDLRTHFITGRGFYGMFLFFVLSGFILGHVHDRDFASRFSPRTALWFLGLRLAKIYPLHALLTVLWPILLVPNVIWPTVPQNNGLSFGMNLLLVQAWGFLPDYTWNIVSWSISVEWFCYLVFPLLPLLVSRRSLPTLFGLVVALQVAIYSDAPARLLGALTGTGPDIRLAAGKQVIHYFQIFLLGYVSFLVSRKFANVTVPRRCWDALVLLVIVAIWAAARRHDLGQWIPLASALVIFGLAQGAPVFGALLGHPIMRYLGEISYCIYLCHVMTNAIYKWYCYEVIHVKPSFWIDVIFAIAVSSLAYHLIETPARLALRRRLAMRTPRSEIEGDRTPATAQSMPAAT